MKQPKTVEEARALPEVNGPLIPFGPEGLEGDTIAWFQDEDGRSMEVVNTPDGWRKTEMWL